MGYVKEFAQWLAQAVYKREMTDQAIVFAVSGHKNIEIGWLKEQITAVRENPKMYRPLGTQPGTTAYTFFDDMRESLKDVHVVGDNDDDYLP
jgi:hypothetical protein